MLVLGTNILENIPSYNGFQSFHLQLTWLSQLIVETEVITLHKMIDIL